MGHLHLGAKPDINKQLIEIIREMNRKGVYEALESIVCRLHFILFDYVMLSVLGICDIVEILL